MVAPCVAPPCRPFDRTYASNARHRQSPRPVRRPQSFAPRRSLGATGLCLGPVADALALDQVVSARKAARELGWSPKAKSVLEDLG
jgi:hypothetical protein